MQAAAEARERGWSTHELFAHYDALRLGATAEASAVHALACDQQGDLAAAIGQHALGIATDGGNRLDEASAALERVDRVVQRAEAATQAVAIHSSAGLRARAASSAERARALLERCEGVSTPIIGVGARRDPLTRREREVATLAAQGLTNKAIAGKVSTSVRTVEGHLYQVYAKLGVSSRESLAGGLTPSG